MLEVTSQLLEVVRKKYRGNCQKQVGFVEFSLLDVSFLIIFLICHQTDGQAESKGTLSSVKG